VFIHHSPSQSLQVHAAQSAFSNIAANDSVTHPHVQQLEKVTATNGTVEILRARSLSIDANGDFLIISADPK
jgi:hypothetical protein